jgi:hypothetical protein
MRILMHDGEVVMYDAWWPHLQAWGMADVKEVKRGRIDYYVAAVSALSKKATYVRADPLTEEELRMHRPELPLSVGSCAEVDWPERAPESMQEFAETVGFAACLNKRVETVVAAPELCLYPFASRGGQKKAVRVKAGDGVAFTLKELLWRAAAVQAPFVEGELPVHGVGLYRSGLQRGIPAYYLWGSVSKLHSSSE